MSRIPEWVGDPTRRCSLSDVQRAKVFALGCEGRKVRDIAARLNLDPAEVWLSLNQPLPVSAATVTANRIKSAKAASAKRGGAK